MSETGPTPRGQHGALVPGEAVLGLALALALWGAAIVSGCGGAEAPPTSPDGGAGCQSDLACSDGIFCNGSELCIPDAAEADAEGCVPAPGPRCLATQQCDEAALRCLTQCELEGDADGDGHDDLSCGGDDCDDADAERYPGNLERCDAEHRDEDCDPSTLGGSSDGDLDGDGFVSVACCNWGGGLLRCGDDCDDGAASVHPEAAEICNGIDEDCDGALDEGVYRTSYVDTDGDGFGDPALRHWGPCIPDPALVDSSTDCDDTDPAIHPGAEELCDGLDNDCDGIVEADADEDGFVRSDAACTGGPLGVGDCNDTERSINPGAEERCDGFDNDCDAAIDQRPAADASCASGLAHTSAICHEATCAISACEDGWRDCNRDRLDGCETDLRSSSNSCGACGVVCLPGEECANGVCQRCTTSSPACPEGSQLGLPSGILHFALSEADGCMVHGSDLLLGGPISCWGYNRDGNRATSSFAGLARPSLVQGVADAIEVALGVEHTCARHVDGSISCWGNSDRGQSGPDGGAFPPTPILVLDASSMGSARALQMAAGRDHTCALMEDGAVLCWGDNAQGQLGRGSIGGSEPLPAPVLGLSAIPTQLAAGDAHTCALLPSGQVECWGRNEWGQLGDGLLPSSGSPLRVQMGGADLLASAVAAGSSHTCAVLASASPPSPTNFVCWGKGELGQLGDGRVELGHASAAPIEPLFRGAGPIIADAIVAGAAHTCARSGSELFCWGDGSRGQLGADADPVPSLPIAEAANSSMGPLSLGVGAVAASGDFTCAQRMLDGRLVCWGASDLAQLGDGSRVDSAAPVPTRMLAAGMQLSMSDEHTCGRRADGWISCTGQGDGYARLETMIGSAAEERFALVDIASFDRVRSVSVGLRHACVLGLDGAIRCTGSNDMGQLGDGSDLDSSAPVVVSGISDAIQLEAGFFHSCALRAAGTVSCWGLGHDGQLGAGAPADLPECGDGTGGAMTVSGLVPYARCSRAPIDVLGLPGPAVQIAIGEMISCARLASGEVYCWGPRAGLGVGSGLLPSCTTTEPGICSTATRVWGIEGAVDLNAGLAHACAVMGSGRVECWGVEMGPLGDGSLSRATRCVFGQPCALEPVRVLGIDDAVHVVAGMSSSCALRASGEVICWGDNSMGQLGNDTGRAELAPGAPVLGLPPTQSLVAGTNAYCAIAFGGGARCWGRPEQVGSGSRLPAPSPGVLRGF